MSAWVTTGGKFALGDAGVAVCDDCPCDEAACSFITSVEATISVTMATGSPVCCGDDEITGSDFSGTYSLPFVSEDGTPRCRYQRDENHGTVKIQSNACGHVGSEGATEDIKVSILADIRDIGSSQYNVSYDVFVDGSSTAFCVFCGASDSVGKDVDIVDGSVTWTGGEITTVNDCVFELDEITISWT